MAYRIVTNSKNRTVLHITSNSTITVAGNNSTSNLCFSDETIKSATIKQVVYYNDANNHIHLKRGANNIGVFSSTGHINYNTIPLSLDKTASIDVVMTGDADGSCLTLDISKETE